MLLGESSVMKQKGEGDEIDEISKGISPCRGIEIGVDIFCFRLGECITLFEADVKRYTQSLVACFGLLGVLISISNVLRLGPVSYETAFVSGS